MISATNDTRFASWLTEHGAIPRKLSRVYASAAVDEAELYQEMLVQLWRSLPRFRERSAPSTWIYRVCLNTALTWRRGERRRGQRVSIEPVAVENAASSEAGPAELASQRDQLALLLDAVQGLPPAERGLVALALDGLAHREIAAITGMTENHVAVALLRSRRRLAQKLKGVGHEF